MRKISFILLCTFVLIMTAQNAPTIKQKASEIKSPIVEKNIQNMSSEEIEKEIQRRVKEEVKKITEKEIQKRVDEELKKRIKNEEPKKIVKKEPVKKEYISSFKETQYAEELFLSGKKAKSRSVLEVLINDNDKKLAEEAHFLLIKWFSDIYFPVIQRSENYNKVISYNNDLKECDKFKKTFPKSKYTKQLKKTMDEKVDRFNKITKVNNFNLVDLKDSCQIEFKGDSTYICTFKKSFKDKEKKKHDLELNISGKISKYDPSGDMQDEWDTSGLLIDNNALIEITLDGNSMIKYENIVKHKQNAEYELRKVTEFGFTQNKTCVKEHNVRNLINLASYLGDDFILSNLEIKTHYGKMNELASMDFIYAEKPNGNFFSDRFKSKYYVELMIDEVSK